jgi:hypothetical protein
MAQDLFQPYIKQLPEHVREDYDDDEVWALNGCLLDVVAAHWTFDDLYSFFRERVVFLTPDAAVVSKCDSPSHHGYSIDMVFLSSNTDKKKTLHITGADEEATAPVLSALLEFFVASSKDESNTEVVFKCFATSPRKPLGTMNLSSIATVLGNCACKVSLSFQFLTIEKPQCEAIFHSSGISSVEFRQCTIGDLGECLRNTVPGIGPLSLKLSCTQHEFANFAKGLQYNTSICELDLLLHFIFQESDIQALALALQGNQGLERLNLQYLDMDDKSWSVLCQSLHHHPKLKAIELSFTDKFADGPRRLTPQRRSARTNDILTLVQTNKTLQQVAWPSFQQDSEIMPAIEKCLHQNKSH